MRRLLLPALVALSCSISAPLFAAEVYSFDKTHTNITWMADHFGFSHPSGKWMDVDGSVTLDEQMPANSKIDAKINIASINTGLEKFDTHLKSADFFDAQKFPQATFVSTKVEPTGEKTAKVTGNLTLKGVTKPVVLEVTLNKIGVNTMFNKKVAGFSATTTIKRSDFNMTYGIPGVADEVKIMIETELSPATAG